MTKKTMVSIPFIRMTNPKNLMTMIQTLMIPTLTAVVAVEAVVVEMMILMATMMKKVCPQDLLTKLHHKEKDLTNLTSHRVIT